MNAGNYISLCSLIIALVMATINICIMSKNNQRTSGKDIKEDERETATILAELKNIMNTVNDIKAEISSIRTDTKENIKAVAIIEQSLKSEHKRLDDMAQRLLALEKKT